MSSSNASSSTTQKQLPLQSHPAAYPPSTASTSASASSSHPPHSTHAGSVQRSLARTVYERRDEYTRWQTIRVKIGSWNVAALPGTEKDLRGWFVEGKAISDSLADLHIGRDEDWQVVAASEHGPAVESVDEQERRASSRQPTIPRNDPGSVPAEAEIGLYVLGLQEVVDISSAAEALRPYNDPHPAKRWKQALSEALPQGYVLVGEQQLSGLLLLIYAAPAVALAVSSVSVTSVGTGLMGYMGNKGAVMARILLGEATRLVFVNSHLAAGTEKGSLDRRNWDAAQIVARTKFDPLDYGNGVIDEFPEVFGDEDFAFWFGDLNYRLESLPGDDVRRLLMLHTRNEYDVTSAVRKSMDKEIGSMRNSQDSFASSTGSGAHGEDELDPADDPASLQTTLSSLLPHDQLHQQMRTGKAFHDGWKEGPIKFLPTYKYDVGSVGRFDSSEKKRGPSWCDRILYRTRKDYVEYVERKDKEAYISKRDAEMKARGLHEAAADEVLYDYDPETNGANEDDYDENEDAAAGEAVETAMGYEDRLRLEYYTSHQRVLSSDHKPLDAIFELTYAAVDSALKAEVYADVARKLDKDENESRPTITMVVDQSDIKDVSSQGIDFGDVSYDNPKTRSITIANVGRVPATFSFVHDLLPERRRQWLHARFDAVPALEKIDFQQCSIEPGETVNAVLTIHVARLDDVRSLNSKKEKVEDVLVLRVRDGRDYFVPVHGTWLRSAFGLSLEQLIRVPEGGVRSCALDQSLDRQEVKWSAPRELFRLTQALEELLERAVAEWGMREERGRPPWDAAGWPFLRSTWTTTSAERGAISSRIRDGLDTGSPFDFAPDTPIVHNVEAIADTLVAFVDSIRGGIIDDQLWAALSAALHQHAADQEEATRSLIVDVVSAVPARSVAFTSVTFMLARVANEVAPLHPAHGTTAAAAAAALLKRREVERKFVDLFAAAMFKIEHEGRGKERRAGDERRRAVVGAFVHRDGDLGAA